MGLKMKILKTEIGWCNLKS